jgi:hypothetical protein
MFEYECFGGEFFFLFRLVLHVSRFLCIVNIALGQCLLREWMLAGNCC